MRRSEVVRWAMVAFGAIVLGVFAPTPARGATKPVTITCGNSTGALISTPGAYRLTQAVTNCTSDTAIEISSSDVTLDLNGMLIEGIDEDGSVGVDVLVGANRVVVRNGSIRDYDTGVLLRGNKGKAFGLAVSSSDFDGISVSGTKNTISGNTVSANEVIGIATGTGNVIRNNTVTGIFDAIGFTEVGILMSGEGNTVSGNRVSASSLAGILANNAGATDNIVSENIVSGTLGSGIDTNLAGGQRIIGNRVTGSGGSGIFGLGSTRVRGNTVRNNDGHGILLTLTQNKVVGNRASGNKLDGIKVINDVTTKVRRNVANGNGGLGISAGAALVGNGSGENKAKGNVNPQQCDPPQIC